MFTKKTILKFLAALMLTGPIFIACESEKADFDEDIQTSVVEQTNDQLNNREKLAKALSLSIQDADFANVVLEKTKAKENGDRVFLYHLAKDKAISGSNKTFQQELKKTAQANSFFRDDVTDFDLDAAESDPSLSIYLHVPDGMEEEEVDPSRVSRVYISPDDDDYTFGQMVTYFEEGQIREHDILQVPSQPVFVIKSNERVLAYDPATGMVLPYNVPLEAQLGGNLIPEFLSPESLMGIIDGIEYRIVFRGGTGTGGDGPGTGGGDDPPGGGGDDPCEEECERDCLDGKDVMTRFKFSDDHEGWLMGGPEVIMRVFFADNPTNNDNAEFDMIEKRFDIGRKQENKWQVKNAEVINWDVDGYGLAMLYHWVEKDPGSNGDTWPIEFNVGFRESSSNGGNNNGGNNNGGSSNLTFRVRTEIPRNKDDFFGESIIQYCDNWNDPDIPSNLQNDWSTYGYHYVAGDMDFAVKERNY